MITGGISKLSTFIGVSATRAMSPSKIIVVAVAVAVATGVAIVAPKLIGPAYFAHAMRSKSIDKEKQVLYELDHAVVATMLRKFASARQWENPDTIQAYYKNTDPKVPIALRGLGFSIINVYNDRVDMDFGGPFLSFGLSVFPEGVEGKGTKRLGEGIWFYSEDGRIPPP